MLDSGRLVPPAHPRPATRSRTSWDLDIGRFHVGFSRTRETPTLARPAAAPRTAWPFTAGAFTGIGALALIVVGASAAPRLADPVRYMVSVPVPGLIARPAARPPARKAAAVRAPRALASSSTPFEAGDAPYVARAMATGAFQEWEDALGQRRFLTAGPARAVGDRHCRDLALLVRFAEGGSHVRSAERCTTGPVSDAPPSVEAPGEDTSDAN